MNVMMKTSSCPACSIESVSNKGFFGRFSTLECKSCGHMMLERSIEPTQPDDYVVADDLALRKMLKTTRDKEFDISVRLAKQYVPSGHWLDVGCSFGWFMEFIKRGGYDAYGVEPSPTAFEVAIKSFPGRVINGEFPQALANAPDFPSRYSILSTMDVLEHIKDPAPFLHGVRERLLPGGMLLLKVPSNDGILFRLASALSSARHNSVLGRLWQVDFNYPHWHYYSKRSIRAMLERRGLAVIAVKSMPFSFFSTAHDRIRNYNGRREGFLSLAIKTLAAYTLIAASHAFNKFDNIVVLARPIDSIQQHP